MARADPRHIVIDAQIVTDFFKVDARGLDSELTESPCSLISDLGVGRWAYLDMGGQIEQEWRGPVEQEWFDAWLSELFHWP